MHVPTYFFLAALSVILPSGALFAQASFPINSQPRIQDFGIEPTYHGSIELDDYDGDGDLDAIVTGSTRTLVPYDPATRLYRDDAGVFRVVSTNLPDVTFNAVAWSDVDDDGDLDLALQGINQLGGPITDIFRNEGGGTFQPLHVDMPHVSHGSFDWGDVDGDGDDDLLLTGGTPDPHLMRGVTAVYVNDNGSFRRHSAELPGTVTSAAKFADFNLDGQTDVAIAGAPSVLAQPTFSIYLNNGSGFDAAIPSFGLMLGDIAVGDYNGDADPDVLVMGRSLERQPFVNFYQNHMHLDRNLDDYEGAAVVPDLFGNWSGCVQGQ